MPGEDFKLKQKSKLYRDNNLCWWNKHIMWWSYSHQNGNLIILKHVKNKQFSKEKAVLFVSLFISSETGGVTRCIDTPDCGKNGEVIKFMYLLRICRVQWILVSGHLNGFFKSMGLCSSYPCQKVEHLLVLRNFSYVTHPIGTHPSDFCQRGFALHVLRHHANGIIMAYSFISGFL